MPIDIAAILKQQGREDRLGSGAANFFHLIDAADIDFKVEAIIGHPSYPNAGPVDEGSFPSLAYGAKYVVVDTGVWEGDLSLDPVTDYANNDIVERRTGEWGLHLDISRAESTEGILVYNKWDGKFYFFDGTAWREMGTGSLTGAAGETWSVQFKATDGSFTGNSGLLFNNTERRLVLGSDVLLEFGDGTTQGTARNFFGTTGVTSASYPSGFSDAGNTGDRLLVATGPANDPFRNYVRFGNAWVQTGVAGVGQGIQGEDGPTGPTGTTGASLTGFDVNAAGVLTARYWYADGSVSSKIELGYVLGPTGTTGATGSTGAGVTGFRLEDSDGSLRAVFINPNGTTGDLNLGSVKGATGLTGEVFGIPYRYADTISDVNLGSRLYANDGGTGVYISKVDDIGNFRNAFIESWDDSTSTVKGHITVQSRYARVGGDYSDPVGFTGSFVFAVSGVREYSGSAYEISGSLVSGTAHTNFGGAGQRITLGFSRAGDRGATGSIDLATQVYEENTGITHTAVTVNTSFSRLARKVMFLQDDGSLTFDYLFYPDIFNANEFQFGILSFGRGTLSNTQLMSGSNINLGTVAGVTFTATYRQGPPATASIFANPTNEGSGFPIFFPTAAMDTLPGPNHSATLSGTGGANRSTILTLTATGTDYDGVTVRNTTSSTTISFRNHFLYGLTTDAVITGGATGVGMTAGWWFRDYQSTKPVAESILGWSASVTQATFGTPEGYYLYIAYPSRLHDDASFFDDPAIAPIKLNGAAVVGGMALQGYGAAGDAGGLSTINYTNILGWTEPYKVLRTDNTFTTDVFTFEFLSS